jgi:diaminopimelate decarboxylase
MMRDAKMHGFARDAAGIAMLGSVPLADALARARVPTPAYVYDLDAIAAETSELAGALEPRDLVAYAIKANAAGSVVRAIARAGGGADVVSGAELELALGCGIAPERIVMSGVAKTAAEIDFAILNGIRSLMLESVEEVARIAARARALGRRAAVALRLNPGIEIDAHAHVATGHDEAKFGIAVADVAAAWEALDAHADVLDAVGVSTHVGSMLADPSPWLAAARVVCEVARARLASGRRLTLIDFGGGFGIDYGGAPVARPREFARAGRELAADHGLDALGLVVEPGRALVASHGVLVSSVVQAKRSGGRRFVMIDAGMNDLIRPALYGARHRVEPLERAPGGPSWRVVGPVCESADDFGEHPLGGEPPLGVVIRDAGAYGHTMASEYNGRPLPAEIFVASGEVRARPSPGSAAWVRSRLEA